MVKTRNLHFTVECLNCLGPRVQCAYWSQKLAKVTKLHVRHASLQFQMNVLTISCRCSRFPKQAEHSHFKFLLYT